MEETMNRFKLFTVGFCLMTLTGCAEVADKIDKLKLLDPTERGLSMIAAAIVIHGVLTMK